jgi:glutathione S-transferase
MQLYSFPPSPNVRKGNAVIVHLDIADIEHRIVNLAKGEDRRPEFLAINPMGKLPALADDNGLLQAFRIRRGPRPAPCRSIASATWLARQAQ